MPGKNSRLNELASRKQLLVAESDLNRAHLVHEWQTMAGDVRALADQAKTVGAIASVAASLSAGFTSVYRKKSEPAAEKKSWWRTIAKVAGLASTAWSEFRTRPQTQPDP